MTLTFEPLIINTDADASDGNYADISDGSDAYVSDVILSDVTFECHVSLKLHTATDAASSCMANKAAANKYMLVIVIFKFKCVHAYNPLC